MAAAVGQKAIIFAPKTAPPAKVAQLLVFGAQVFSWMVLMMMLLTDDPCRRNLVGTAGTLDNPFTLEGRKQRHWKYGM
jgi:threonine synthase